MQPLFASLPTVPLPHLPRRTLTGHKGTYGRVVVVGGSQGMAGAAALSGMAALRGGAGLVQVATPASVQATVAAFEPALMTIALPEDSAGRMVPAAFDRIAKLAEGAACLALGPGLGQSTALPELVARLYAELAVPVVVDADGLNALAEGAALPQRSSGAPRIFTPHPGEFGRLLRLPTAEVLAQREALARDYAQRQGIVLLVKGWHSFLTDGQREAVNLTGNPGMATGGAGDVLTGLIAALVAQGWPPLEAVRLGAHLHGLAGDLAQRALGPSGLTASDLVRRLPAAIDHMTK